MGFEGNHPRLVWPGPLLLVEQGERIFTPGRLDPLPSSAWTVEPVKWAPVYLRTQGQSWPWEAQLHRVGYFSQTYYNTL